MSLKTQQMVDDILAQVRAFDPRLAENIAPMLPSAIQRANVCDADTALVHTATSSDGRKDVRVTIKGQHVASWIEAPQTD